MKPHYIDRTYGETDHWYWVNRYFLLVLGLTKDDLLNSIDFPSGILYKSSSRTVNLFLSWNTSLLDKSQVWERACCGWNPRRLGRLDLLHLLLLALQEEEGRGEEKAGGGGGGGGGEEKGQRRFWKRPRWRKKSLFQYEYVLEERNVWKILKAPFTLRTFLVPHQLLQDLLYKHIVNI